MSLKQWLETAGWEAVSKVISRSFERGAPRRKRPADGPTFNPESLEARRLLAAGPSLLSIARATPAGPNTGSASVSYTVTFDVAVTNVNAADFNVVTSGSVTTSPNIAVTPVSSSVYTVSIFGISGTGALRLDLSPSNNIQDTFGDPLSTTNSQASFQTQQTNATSPYPRSVAIADVNGDGKPDLITANGSGSVSVLLGNGDGTFQAQKSFFAGTAPYTVAVADLNGDGKLDLAVTNSGAANVAVLLGNGNGTFKAPQTFATGTAPQSDVATDVNGDGIPDLIVSNYVDNSVSVLLGNGNGTFQAQQTYATASAPFFVTAADVNGDSRPDIIVADSAAKAISVFLSNGNGTFQPQQTFFAGRLPKSVAVTDVNGDGKADVIVANNYNAMAGVLFGNGDGTFQAARSFGVGQSPQFATAADINGDGLPDVVVANSADSTISLLLNTGIGTFQAQRTVAVGGFPASIAIGDLTGDGQPDIVVANESGNSLSVLVANGQGSLTGQTYTISSPSPLKISLGGTIPASVIAGQKIKANPAITFNNMGGTFKGSVTETFYLSSGTTVDSTAIALPQSLTKTLNLKSGGHSTVHVKLSSLPASIPNGTYHLLVNLTEPGGVTAFAASTQTITVAPPEIVLGGSVAKVAAAAKAGKPLAVTISVSDTGNIPATGPLPMLVYTSPDGLLADATQISSQSHKISIKPGKTIRFTLSKLLAPATPGSYFILVRLDPAATFPAVTNPDVLLTSATAVTVS